MRCSISSTTRRIQNFGWDRGLAMKRLMATVLVVMAIVPALCAAEPAWEYRVIYLPGTTAGSQTQQMPGGLVDLDKTATLNHLAAEGWEVIGMTGSVGADHAVYLRRASAHQGPQ